MTIYDSTTVVGDVKIGENTWIGPFCSIDGGGGLEIGENCDITSETDGPINKGKKLVVGDNSNVKL